MRKSRVILAIPPMMAAVRGEVLDALRKLAVDLQLRERKVIQIGERRKSCSEIIERNANADLTQFLENGVNGGGILEKQRIR